MRAVLCALACALPFALSRDLIRVLARNAQGFNPASLPQSGQGQTGNPLSSIWRKIEESFPRPSGSMPTFGSGFPNFGSGFPGFGSGMGMPGNTKPTGQSSSSEGGMPTLSSMMGSNGLSASPRGGSGGGSDGGGGGGSGGGNDAATVKQVSLQEHNDFRAKHEAGPLTWDQNLADACASWITSCSYSHSPQAEAGQYGENIAWGQGFQTLPLMNLWEREGAPPGVLNHYTAMVWKATTTLGCAQQVCPDSYNYLCCHYGPQAGNIEGQEAQNVS
ncbi:uncharacterized protein L969DRAFT_94457 [Mixia osmundae IAM 14324]|uniref:SCP domain-containing protein n=1 Tax=Mixia osmundae (strain CBS 9802 / IAM 14324 / JCM 22182 / KY 12970) TaxID=764103 RepID=G7E3J1_MIXOS|nr:uncharacterized protein L969DRAFT_94457 [Mixia osmundae IAM 14324]KEI39387.1 hypothetical protein L969DRAFT_94457 [Mixia osmundae IAM 14324]GAA97401.1 hypothetical protein E5Q_04079 [Mixia osmundae IAM 14324]